MFLIANQGSLTLSQKELSLSLMQNLVGVEGEESYIEILRQQFSDPNIDLVFDDNFLSNPDCFESCVTPKDKVLHGQVLAVGVKNGETIGLTPSQLEIVCKELLIFENNQGILVSSKALYFFH
jgi:hypothetical protein